MFKKIAKNKLFFGSVLLSGGIGYTYYKSYMRELQHIKNFQKTNPDKYLSLENKPVTELKTRDQHLQEIQKTDEYDVMIIGGGCNGTGVLLDAASRGLKCLLVEEYDFAEGASSKSTKLIHGGVRYLTDVFSLSLEGPKERMEKLKLVVEALEERSHMLDNAFYMNKLLPLIIPCENLFWAVYYYFGSWIYHCVYLWNYDRKASIRFPNPTFMGPTELKSCFKYMGNKYKYGIIYYDGQMNDTRMNLDVILTSTLDSYKNGMKGSNAINYMKFEKFLKDEKGVIIGGALQDKIQNKKMEIKAKCVINCTGSFADKIRQMDNPNCQQRILPVEGTHLIMPQEFGHNKNAILIPKTADGRVLFIIPWQKYILIGTTELKYNEPVISPKVNYKNLIFLQQEIANLYPNLDPTIIAKNIKSKWAGLRPVVYEIDPNSKDTQVDTKKAARKHVIEISDSGLISLMGGKWTVYRKMGEETVDSVIQYLKSNKNFDDSNLKNSQTKYMKLVGSFQKEDHYSFPDRKTYITFYSNIIEKKYGISKDIAEHLIKTYGERSFDVLQLTNSQPELKENIIEGHPEIKAEILYQIRNEFAVYPRDVVLRRTRLGFLDQQAMFKALPTIIDIFAKEFKWDKSKAKEQLNKEFQEIAELDF